MTDEVRATFGILSSLAILVGAFPYIYDIHKLKAHPQVLSWVGWGFLTGLGASAMMAEGSTWPALILFANTAASWTIALYSIVRRVGVWRTNSWDFVFFGIGVLGLILWQVLDMPKIKMEYM